mgnify:CR=1 FL=1
MELYITRQKEVQARQITEQSEMVDCYNGFTIGTHGDFIVCDEQGKVMVIKENKFKQKYKRWEIGDAFSSEH